MSEARALFEKTWVQALEEASDEGVVFRPQAAELPLSRRPRQRLTFFPDGKATVVVTGPDDRLHDVEARWTENAGEITVEPEPSARSFRTLHLRLKADDRLIAR